MSQGESRRKGAHRSSRVRPHSTKTYQSFPGTAQGDRQEDGPAASLRRQPSAPLSENGTAGLTRAGGGGQGAAAQGRGEAGWTG